MTSYGTRSTAPLSQDKIVNEKKEQRKKLLEAVRQRRMAIYKKYLEKISGGK